jgi:hypothetical protein
MEKTYLVELLSKLSSKQMRELSDFVKSPFFNKNESVEKLFEYLRVAHPEFKPLKIEKELVYKKLFSPAEYNDSFMRMLIFKLTELSERYLAYSEMTQKPADEYIYLAGNLLELGLDKNAQRVINQTEKELEQIRIKEGKYFLKKFELEKLKHIIYSRTYKATTVKDKPDESLLEESNYLTEFFLINILQRYRYLLNKGQTVNSHYELDFLPHILKFLENEGKHYLKNITVSLLYRQVKLQLDPSDEKKFYEIKKELCNDATLIDDEDRRDGATILVNLCIEKGYKGKDEFYKLVLEIDEYLVSRNLYNRVKGGYFDSEMFMNIVTIALRLGRVEWTKEFIDSNYKKLAPDIMENIRNFTYARLYFKTRELDKALHYISKVTYTDLHMKINARITSITIHYELGNIEEVLMQIENFRKYIQNDKLLSTGHRKISSNFIKYAGSICKARYSPRVNLAELKKNIEDCEMVNNRKWLVDKVSELMQRKQY